MVGAWPTHIDLNDRRSRDGPFQVIVDGVLQPVAGTTSPTLNGVPPPAKSDTPSVSSGGKCTGLVFRGALGGDRAVKANVPFPWMESLPRSRVAFAPQGASSSQGKVNTLDANGSVEASIKYPHSFLANVRSGSPFSTRWPGHKAHEDAGPEGGAGDAAVARGVGILDKPAWPGLWPGGSAQLDALREELIANGVGIYGDGYWNGSGMADSTKTEEFKATLDRIPSSGPSASFRAGYTAYFEISVGEKMEPLVRAGPWGFELDQCVAIGLATARFPIT